MNKTQILSSKLYLEDQKYQNSKRFCVGTISFFAIYGFVDLVLIASDQLWSRFENNKLKTIWESLDLRDKVWDEVQLKCVKSKFDKKISVKSNLLQNHIGSATR